MALVSYDQVANTSEKTSSLLYWTIVGAYVVKGNKNDVQTFVDTAVFDMATRKLLFRAPGVSDDPEQRDARRPGTGHARDAAQGHSSRRWPT